MLDREFREALNRTAQQALSVLLPASPVSLREAIAAIPMALLIGSAIVIVPTLESLRDFHNECKSITNDLIDFNQAQEKVIEQAEATNRVSGPVTEQSFQAFTDHLTNIENQHENLFLKQFATRIQVVCNDIREHRFWNPGLEEQVCAGTGEEGILKWKPQAVEALSMEISWQEWLTSWVTVKQILIMSGGVFIFWFLFAAFRSLGKIESP